MMPKPADSPVTAAADPRLRGVDDSPSPASETRLRHPTRSIGQVMAILRTEFPEISISKIRFLEAEGLITPQRAPSGYRRYTESDVERLRYVLSVQREHYLPLKVIREHLEQIDRGQTQLGLTQGAALGAGSAAGAQSQNSVTAKQPIRLTRQELLDASGLTEAALSELERTQICTPDEEPPTTAGTPSRWRSPRAGLPSTASMGDICGRSSYPPTAKSGSWSKQSRRTYDGQAATAMCRGTSRSW